MRRPGPAWRTHRRRAPRAPVTDRFGAARHGPPALAQRPVRLISLDHRLHVRAAEQCQHGQVRLPVAAVRGRVDQHRAAGRPHHVSAPRSPCSRAGGSSSSNSPASHRAITASMASRGPVQARRGSVGHRCQPLVGVEAAPPIAGGVRHRQRLVKRPEVARAGPTIGRCTESVGPRVVGAGQPPPNSCAAARVGAAASSRSNVRPASSCAMTLAHGTPPLVAESHCSPAASQAKKPRGATALRLTNTRAGRIPVEAPGHGPMRASSSSGPPAVSGRRRRRSGRGACGRSAPPRRRRTLS